MSAPGCCRHCGDDCTAGMPSPYLFGHQSEGETAAWDDEACPACDESERIAVGIQARMDRAQLRDRFEVGYARGLHYALGVVEGQTVD